MIEIKYKDIDQITIQDETVLKLTMVSDGLAYYETVIPQEELNNKDSGISQVMYKLESSIESADFLDYEKFKDLKDSEIFNVTRIDQTEEHIETIHINPKHSQEQKHKSVIEFIISTVGADEVINMALDTKNKKQ